MADSVTTMEHAQLADPAAGEAPGAAETGFVFGGDQRNMAMGVAMAGAGAAAFVLGLTTTFFAQAIAITFIFWGAFFLYTDLLLSTRRYIVREDGLQIDVPMRPWSRNRTWAWADVNRLDVITYRRDIDQTNSNLQVHHQYPGEIALEREDRNFDPALVRLIIERAKLKPVGDAAKVDLSALPTGVDATYTWKK